MTSSGTSSSHGNSSSSHDNSSFYCHSISSQNGQTHTGSHGNTTTEAAQAHQDGYAPHPLEMSDGGEMDTDKDIAELLGLLSPEQSTSIQW